MNNRFLILVGSRNNAPWVENNIGSILKQDYPHYKVLYFDDASEDGTVGKVKELIKDDKRFVIYDFYKERKYKTWFFSHVKPQNDNDIVVFLDGDDFFASENVLSYLNSVYIQTNCWMTYGGMRVWDGGNKISEPYPQNSEIPREIIRSKAYRKDTWRTSHLKSMRAFLWNAFDKKDLCPDGTYMVGPDDLAIMYSVLELCPPDKVFRVTDPLYIYNHSSENQYSRAYADHKKSNIDYEKILRARTPYETISFVTPTLAGGLGNQMFEIAAAASLAKDNGAVLIVNPEEHILPNQGRNVKNYIDNIFKKIMMDSTIQPKNFFNRPTCTYSPIPYFRNLKLNGHFQSWKYFHHNQYYIQNLFSTPNFVLENISKKYFNVDFNKTTGIQVRRGDYYKFPDHHPLLNKDYYKEAVDKIKPEKIMVFSDDIEWCEDNFNFKAPTTYIKEEDYIEFYMLSMCHNLVISNSSFGWWCSYLNNHPDKKIYAPSVWFGQAMVDEGFNIDDLVLPSWIKVSV